MVSEFAFVKEKVAGPVTGVSSTIQVGRDAISEQSVPNAFEAVTFNGNIPKSPFVGDDRKASKLE